jgi:hypothetical protein
LDSVKLKLLVWNIMVGLQVYSHSLGERMISKFTDGWWVVAGLA